MPTLNISGRRVTVDDSFLKLSPEQQNATVDEIARSLGVIPAFSQPQSAAQAAPSMPQAPAQTASFAPQVQPAGVAQPAPPADDLVSAATRSQDPLDPISALRIQEGRVLTDPQQRRIAETHRRARAAPLPPLSESEKITGRIGAGIEGFAQGATLGTSDEIAAGLQTGFGTLGDYDRALQRERYLMGLKQKYFPYTRGAAEIGGAVASGVRTAGALPALGGAAFAVPRAAAVGAAEGAAYGFGTGRGLEDRLSGAKTGAVVGGALGAAGGKLSKALAKRAARKAIPTAEELAQEASEAYSQAESAGVVVAQKPFKEMVDSIVSATNKAGFDAQLHPSAKPRRPARYLSNSWEYKS